MAVMDIDVWRSGSGHGEQVAAPRLVQMRLAKGLSPCEIGRPQRFNPAMLDCLAVANDLKRFGLVVELNREGEFLSSRRSSPIAIVMGSPPSLGVPVEP
jgi:hypothetical protein